MTTSHCPTAPTGPSSNISQSVSIREIKLNHPKNYLAVPLAIAASGETDSLIETHAVSLPYRARRGAIETDLITADETLTSLGETVIAIARDTHGSPEEALEAFATIRGSPVRFTEHYPHWRALSRRLAFKYEPTQRIVDLLREQGALSLSELVKVAWEYERPLATEVFLHPDFLATHAAPLELQELADSAAYRSEATFQFKAFLYHADITTTRGKDTASLEPEADTWALTESF